MHTAAVPVRQGLGRKAGAQAILRRHRADHRAEGDGVVRRRQRIGIAEVDLVLARSALVVGALRLDAHLLQHQADLPADMLSLVVGGDIHVAGLVVGDGGGPAVFIELEEIEFHLRAEGEVAALGGGIGHGFFQDAAGVPLEGPAIGVENIAEHPHDLALLRPPRKLDQRGRVRPQQQVGTGLAAKAINGRGVDGDAVFKGAAQLAGHDGHVVLPAVDIAEGQADEPDVLLLYELHDLFLRILHSSTSFIQHSIRDIQLPVGVAAVGLNNGKGMAENIAAAASEQMAERLQIRFDAPQILLAGGTGNDLAGQEDIFAIRAEKQPAAVHTGAGEVADDGTAAFRQAQDDDDAAGLILA